MCVVRQFRSVVLLRVQSQALEPRSRLSLGEGKYPWLGSSLGSSSSVARVGSALCRTGSGSNAVSTGLNSGIPASALNLLPWSKLSSPSGKRSVTYPRLRAVVLLASSRGHQAEVVGRLQQARKESSRL